MFEVFEDLSLLHGTSLDFEECFFSRTFSTVSRKNLNASTHSEQLPSQGGGNCQNVYLVGGNIGSKAISKLPSINPVRRENYQNECLGGKIGCKAIYSMHLGARDYIF